MPVIKEMDSIGSTFHNAELNDLRHFYYVHKRLFSLKYCSQICLNQCSWGLLLCWDNPQVTRTGMFSASRIVYGSLQRGSWASSYCNARRWSWANRPLDLAISLPSIKWTRFIVPNPVATGQLSHSIENKKQLTHPTPDMLSAPCPV